MGAIPKSDDKGGAINSNVPATCVKDFKESHTDTTVLFTVTLLEGNYDDYEVFC